ncbi:hypothetical protein H4R35_006246 [Dimargaris xerosporica]|nr:hypothetical protein H4R35_006246 [Dimargaris xerosporica]
MRTRPARPIAKFNVHALDSILRNTQRHNQTWSNLTIYPGDVLELHSYTNSALLALAYAAIAQALLGTGLPWCQSTNAPRDYPRSAYTDLDPMARLGSTVILVDLQGDVRIPRIRQMLIHEIRQRIAQHQHQQRRPPPPPRLVRLQETPGNDPKSPERTASYSEVFGRALAEDEAADLARTWADQCLRHLLVIRPQTTVEWVATMGHLPQLIRRHWQQIEALICQCHSAPTSRSLSRCHSVTARQFDGQSHPSPSSLNTPSGATHYCSNHCNRVRPSVVLWLNNIMAFYWVDRLMSLGSGGPESGNSSVTTQREDMVQGVAWDSTLMSNIVHQLRQLRRQFTLATVATHYLQLPPPRSLLAQYNNPTNHFELGDLVPFRDQMYECWQPIVTHQLFIVHRLSPTPTATPASTDTPQPNQALANRQCSTHHGPCRYTVVLARFHHGHQALEVQSQPQEFILTPSGGVLTLPRDSFMR